MAEATERTPARYDYWFIAQELTGSAFKLRDQGTLLGFLWTLLQPLAMLAVLYWLFRRQVGADVPNFGLYVLVGIVLWTFFASGTSKGLLSLVSRRDLIDSVAFPRELIVVSAVLTVLISASLEFLVVLLFALVSGAGISWAWLVLPLVLLIEGMLVLGCALLLAPWYVHARDLDNIWSILIRIGFFLTPVFYLPERFLSPGELQLYRLNPITQLMTYARQIILQHEAPGPLAMAGTAAIALAIVGLGIANFRYFSADLAEHI